LRDPKLGKIDAKNYISERYLKKLEEEGFVKLMGRSRERALSSTQRVVPLHL
jgi:hypothetical protein